MSEFKPPSPPYIPARWHGGPQVPKAITIHGTVSHDDPGTARAIAKYFQSVDRKASAHYIVDPKEIIQSVWDHTVAFHCGYNTGSIALELCDEQVGPASRWDDADSRAILKRAARLTAQLCLAYNIQVKRPTVAELKAKGPHGIYGHNDSRLAFGNTTHTDPRDFDWPEFIGMVKAEVARIKDGGKQSAPTPTNPTPAVRPLVLDIAHFSMQYSDTAAQKKSDVSKMFVRGYDWITGTEAGEEPLKGLLRDTANAHGYAFVQYKSNWIAVRKDIFKPGTYKTSFKTVVENDLVIGPGHDVNVVGVHFTHRSLGDINVLCSHYPTKGRPDATNPTDRRNLKWTQKLAHALGDMADELGKGNALVFYGGDQNINDVMNDTFFGEQLTSAWDELKHYERSHWSTIDVIASYDNDLRVSAKYVRALDDKEFPFHSDHFPVEAGYYVRPLAQKGAR